MSACVPGASAGDCKRCGSTTVMIGQGHAVYGVLCEECDLVRMMPNQEVTGSTYVELPEPEEAMFDE